MELKNCPFCGSPARFNTDEGGFYKNVVKNGCACVSISCTNTRGCGVTQFCHYESNDYDVMKENAIERWNRRCGNE